MGHFSDFWRQTRGNVTLLFALSFVVVVASVGGAIDFFHAAAAKHNLQDAIDAAVLAGVRAPSSQMATVASTAFSGDVPAADAGASQSYSSAFASSSSSASFLTTTLTGTASLDTPTYALKLVGINTVSVKATATAIGTTPLVTPAATCIYVLDPSGSQALLVNSGASVSASGCRIDVKSTGNPASMFNSGSSLNFKKVCLQGGNATLNSTTVPNSRPELHHLQRSLHRHAADAGLLDLHLFQPQLQRRHADHAAGRLLRLVQFQQFFGQYHLRAGRLCHQGRRLERQRRHLDRQRRHLLFRRHRKIDHGRRRRPDHRRQRGLARFTTDKARMRPSPRHGFQDLPERLVLAVRVEVLPRKARKGRKAQKSARQDALATSSPDPFLTGHKPRQGLNRAPLALIHNRLNSRWRGG
ncbi:MAG: pilus assembly protein TadG-related protein [Asticcacaulis sp.]